MWAGVQGGTLGPHRTTPNVDPRVKPEDDGVCDESRCHTRGRLCFDGSSGTTDQLNRWSSSGLTRGSMPKPTTGAARAHRALAVASPIALIRSPAHTLPSSGQAEGRWRVTNLGANPEAIPVSTAFRASPPGSPTVILGLDPRIHAQANCTHGGICLHRHQPEARHTLYRRDVRSRAADLRASRGPVQGFAAKNGCNQLVWYEEHASIGTAIQRETLLKRWYRQWKIELIEQMNPQWRDDLYQDFW